MAKKGDTKPRGRMSSYAYFVQTAREEHKKKHPNQAVVFSEFSKQCAERWKKMGEKEKGKYQTMAEKDKQRYDNEMEGYVPSKEDKKGKKAKKDPNAPKRALSAFFWFCSDERPKVKATLGADSSVGDVAKELGKKWNALNASHKTKYETLAQKDKARYAKEIAAYKAKGGAGAASGGKKAPAGKKTAKSKKQVESSEEEESEEEEEDEDDDDDDEDED